MHLAAIYDPGKVADLDAQKAAQIVTVNLAGTFHVAQVAPKVLRAGGQMALCGSVAGYIGLPQGQIYSATKAGVINLAETLRAELSGKVDVRLINPGFVETRLTAQNDFDMPAMVTPRTRGAGDHQRFAGAFLRSAFPAPPHLAAQVVERAALLGGTAPDRAFDPLIPD